MDKKRFVDMKLIQKFIQKNKKREIVVQQEINSTNVVFLALLFIGFLGMIIFYKYLEKSFEKKKESEEKKDDHTHSDDHLEEKDIEPAIHPVFMLNAVPQKDSRSHMVEEKK